MLSLGSCSPAGGAKAVVAGSEPASEVPVGLVVPATEPIPEEKTLVLLEGFSGDPEALWGEVTYKVKRDGRGALLKSFEVELQNATPGEKHALTLDGFEVAVLVIDRKGESELELFQNDEEFLPEGFPEPAAGSVIRVGELMELRLDALEKLADLEALIPGPGLGLGGKVTYKVERLAGVTTEEFQVKVQGAPPDSLQTVTLDGAEIGSLAVDSSGKGKLKFSTKEALAFPASFHAPVPGSHVRIGDLFAGALQDELPR